MISEEVVLRSGDGVELHGAVEWEDTPRAALVVCHAHPRMGGTMDSPLLLHLRDDLVRRGWGVVRFDFRGVGSSSGTSGTGIDEVEDALAGISEARRRWPGSPTVLMGWSFGGGVAVRAAARDAGIAAVVAIAPAVEEKPGVTAGIPPGGELDLRRPLLVVCGANDDQVDPALCKAWAEAIEGATYREIPAANHFFWARYEKLSAIVTEWLDQTV